ncbi:hypothetical protein QQF64_002678, partial [Cirrhinus molitorella]
IQYERIGSDVTMQCGSLDNDASVTWKVNGTDVKARRREEGPRLILMELLGHGQAGSANKISSAAKCLNENGMVPIPQTGRGPSA